jgi:hypothetical protein
LASQFTGDLSLRPAGEMFTQNETADLVERAQRRCMPVMGKNAIAEGDSFNVRSRRHGSVPAGDYCRVMICF